MLMRTFPPALIGLLVAGCAAAQAPKVGQDHPAHHPGGSAAAPSPDADGPAAAPDAFERQFQSMRDMHRRMQAARTPAERAALMDEHMKLMQSGMAMMGQMRSNPGGMSPMSGMGMHDRMERRMAMMEQMMQMMVDREAATAP